MYALSLKLNSKEPECRNQMAGGIEEMSRLTIGLDKP